MHTVPNYKQYTLSELNEALAGLDHHQYPERMELIRAEILAREKAGHVLSAEDGRTQFWAPQVSWRYVALPIWWTFFWRSSLANVLLSLLLLLAFRVLAALLSAPPESAGQAVLLMQVITLPVCGVFFMKQALARHYDSFRVMIQERDI